MLNISVCYPWATICLWYRACDHSNVGSNQHTRQSTSKESSIKICYTASSVIGGFRYFDLLITTEYKYWAFFINLTWILFVCITYISSLAHTDHCSTVCPFVHHIVSAFFLSIWLSFLCLLFCLGLFQQMPLANNVLVSMWKELLGYSVSPLFHWSVWLSIIPFVSLSTDQKDRGTPCKTDISCLVFEITDWNFTYQNLYK